MTTLPPIGSRVRYVRAPSRFCLGRTRADLNPPIVDTDTEAFHNDKTTMVSLPVLDISLLVVVIIIVLSCAARPPRSRSRAASQAPPSKPHPLPVVRFSLVLIHSNKSLITWGGSGTMTCPSVPSSLLLFEFNHPAPPPSLGMKYARVVFSFPVYVSWDPSSTGWETAYACADSSGMFLIEFAR
jgi:hypothetical protein